MSRSRGRVGDPLVLYFITDPISTRLLRGQLAAVRAAGFAVGLVSADGAELHDAAQREGVTAHVVRFVRPISPLADLRALGQTISLIRRTRPDIVNASTPKAGLLAMVASFLCRVPVRVYVLRGLRLETSTGVSRALLVTLERVATASATIVLCNSASLRSATEDCHAIAHGKGLVLGHGSGNGIDTSRFEDLPSQADARHALGLPADATVIGFVGRYTADKGIADLAAAFRNLRQRHPSLILCLVGRFETDDPVDPETTEFIRTDPGVLDAGWHADLSTIYPAFDLLSFPSYREGLPNVPLEAQACSIPVVGYAATGTVDSVIDGVTARMVPVGDLGALADAIESLILNPGTASTMGRDGREFVAASFDPEQVWAGIIDMYRHGLAPWASADTAPQETV